MTARQVKCLLLNARLNHRNLLEPQGTDRGRRLQSRPLFTPTKPGGQCGPTATTHVHQERGNPRAVLRERSSAQQVSTACRAGVGLPKKRKAWGKAQDMLT